MFELDFQDAKYNEGKLINSFKVHGLHAEYLKEKWVAFLTFGANAMIGKHCRSEQAEAEVPLYLALP
jgi:hypothetical protein